MPNLLGATLESDRADFARLWEDCAPDEIKIYPTQLLEGTGLYRKWQAGKYTPYTTEELIDLIAGLKPGIPPYCRVNRIIRDIPSPHIVAGNKRSSLRQDVLAELNRRGQSCGCIRCHEVGPGVVLPENLKLEDFTYPAGGASENFLTFRTPAGKIAAYLRLSLPGSTDAHAQVVETIPELAGCALVREVHVYGQVQGIGHGQEGAAQHIGLGTRLLKEATRVALAAGFQKLAVISAVGTRKYYAARGFQPAELYMIKQIEH
jgi:elongator complex protein 3